MAEKDVAADVSHVSGFTPPPLLNADAAKNISLIVALLVSENTIVWLKLVACLNMSSRDRTFPVVKVSGAAPVLPISPLLNAAAPENMEFIVVTPDVSKAMSLLNTLAVLNMDDMSVTPAVMDSESVWLNAEHPSNIWLVFWRAVVVTKARGLPLKSPTSPLLNSVAPLNIETTLVMLLVPGKVTVWLNAVHRRNMEVA